MLKRWTLGLAVVLLAVAAPVRADDAADVKGIIDKAIKATGGEEKLAANKNSTWSAKGKFYGFGEEGIAYTLTVSQSRPGRYREQIEADAMGQKFVIIKVMNGDKGYVKQNDDLTELEGDMLKEEQETLHALNVSNLLALKAGEATVTAAGETKVGDKPAVGIKVASKGKRDLTLYFDKESGLLVKAVRRAKDMMSGDEVTLDTVFENYKDFDGIKRPTKMKTNRDGKLLSETEITDFKAGAKFDETTFAKP
jgi:hypothetical protein